MPSEPPRRVVLFTGLLRHPDMFERQLELIRDLDCVDRRIFATWTDDYEKHEPYLKDLSGRFGLEIVHAHQPPFVKNNFLHQMLSLELGLAQVGDRDLVCKTRTDLVIEPQALAHVFGKPRRLEGPGLHQDLFLHARIDIVEAQLGVPFMYDDILFCGVASDLGLFINMEMKFQIIYKCHSYFHERYWGNLFSTRLSFLRDHYKNSWVFGGDDGIGWTLFLGSVYRRRMTDFAMRDPDYGTMMALSYRTTAEMFSMDWGPAKTFFAFKGTWAQSVGPRWTRLHADGFATLGDVFAPDEHYTEPAGLIATCSDRVMARLAAGDFGDCPIGRNIRRGLDLLEGATLGDLQNAADMRGFTARAVAHSKQVVHDLLPRFQQHAHMLAGTGRVGDAELLINNLITHLAA